MALTSRVHSPLATAAVAVLLITGPGLTRAAAPSAVPETTSPPTVVVVDAGSEPRTLLRYRFSEGDHQTAALGMSMTMSMEGDGEFAPVTSPLTTVTMDVDVIDVTPTGVATLVFAYTGITVQEDPAVDAATVESLRARLTGIVGTTGTFTVDARGQVLAATVTPSPGMDADIEQSFESLSQQARQMTVPLPESAVGEGARWTATTQMTVNGLRSEQATEYRITRLGSGSVELALTVTQTAERQPMGTDGLPPGMEAFAELSNHGAGSMSIHLDRLLPVSSLESEGEMVLAITYEGQTTTVVSTIALAATLQPAEPSGSIASTPPPGGRTKRASTGVARTSSAGHGRAVGAPKRTRAGQDRVASAAAIRHPTRGARR